MDSIVLIMASGGEDGAWVSDEFPNKLLVPIVDEPHCCVGEPLVVRAVRQVKEITGIDPVVLTHWPEVQEVVPLYFVPEKHYTYTETFMSAREVWEGVDRVIVLNGDMLWHPDVLEFVLGHDGSLVIYGDRTGNGFAWAFDRKHVERVIRAALHTRNNLLQAHFFRRLWGVGTLRDSKSFIRVQPSKTYTQDFDTANNFDPEVVRRRLGES